MALDNSQQNISISQLNISTAQTSLNNLFEKLNQLKQLVNQTSISLKRFKTDFSSIEQSLNAENQNIFNENLFPLNSLYPNENGYKWFIKMNSEIGTRISALESKLANLNELKQTNINNIAKLNAKIQENQGNGN